MILLGQLILIEGEIQFQYGVYFDIQKRTMIDSFFGKSSLEIKNKSKFDNEYIKIKEVNSYEVEKLEKGFINLSFCVDDLNRDDKVEAAIIFIKRADDVVTTGIKLFDKLPTQSVVLLKENEELQLYNQKLFFKDGEINFYNLV